MADTLINRVAQSGIKTIDLESFYPSRTLKEIDIKDYLFQGLILREKDFRSALKDVDWSQYADFILCIHCSTDAIIPVWAYMLISSYAADIAFDIYTGNKSEYLKGYYNDILVNQDLSEYEDDRVVIKGCSNKPVPASAYAKLTQLLKPLAKSIMYGEPCSTVPIYKKPR